EVTMPADIEGGEVRVRIDGAYLTEALRACGGMVDFKLTDGKSPVLFVVDGYQLVVMPMQCLRQKASFFLLLTNHHCKTTLKIQYVN
ncbi:hypothetical protein ACFLVG_05960, partial [Chloroflexota bacterium]